MNVGRREITGIVGRIEWGYFVAGAVNNYTLRPNGDGGWLLTATLVHFDAFKMRQRPLIFVAPHKSPEPDTQRGVSGEWRWPMKELELGPGHGPRELRAVLGQQCPEMMSALSL